MPIKRKDRGDKWLARVQVEGRVVDSLMFPPGPKGGKSWRDAKEWEENRKAEILAGLKTHSDLQLFSNWLRLYVDHAKRTMTLKVAKEKAVFLAHFSAESLKRGIDDPSKITPQWAHEYLGAIFDQRGGHVANKYRKHLLAAWNWGADMVDGFPDRVSPFLKVKPFQVEHQDRYVPPDEDVAAVLAQVAGQDAVMLLAYIQTGARKTELFHLTWKDVDLENRRLRLTDRKGGGGALRERWQAIDESLAAALEWWKEARPLDVPNVFMQPADHRRDVKAGDPFKHRKHFMGKLCRRAGVKPFGFHALRHKGAAIVFTAEGLNEAQLLMGHHKATTTDRYVKSAGLYAGGQKGVNAIMKSSVGRAAAEQVKKVMAPEAATSKANSNRELVTK